MSSVTDFPDWAPHVATADQIASTGVPLLTGSTLLNNSSNSIPASGNKTLGPFAVSQIGYELVASCLMANAATNPYVTIELSWIDAGTGVQVATDSFSTICGAASLAFLPTTARGPSKADQLSVTIFNNDTVQSATVDIVLVQNSRIYPRDDFFWVSQYPNTLLVPAFTLAKQVPDENCLGIMSNVTIAASSSVTNIFGIYDGPVIVGISMHAGTLANINVNFSAQPDSIYGGINELYGGTPTQNSWFIAGPRAPIKCLINNNVTTAVRLSLSLFRFN